MLGKLFVISAPSGAGKTTLVQALLRDFKGICPLERVITYTSKKPRPSEVDGIDYHFITPEEFESRINQGFFLEWSMAYGAYYGSPRYLLTEMAQGKSYIAILDRSGAQAIAETVPGAVLMWITVPSMAILRERLISRGQDSEQQMTNRLLLAQKELKEEEKKTLFHYAILNDSFEKALKNIKNIITTCLGGNKGLTSS